MAFEISSLDVLYSYGQAASSTLPIKYSYGQRTATTAELDVVYQVDRSPDAARWEKANGYWAWSTQEVGNLFPRWHVARLDPGGLTQNLINAWGVNLDALKREYARFRRDLFLQTAEVEQPDLFYYAGLRDFDEIDKPRSNALRNSAFSLPTLARYSKPMHWTTYKEGSTGTVELVTSPVFVGSHSVKMHAEDGEDCYLAQAMLAGRNVGTDMVASLWYMSPMPVDQVTTDEWTAALILSVIYADGSAETQTKALRVGTNGQWVRDYVTLNASKEVYLVKYMIRIHNTSGNAIRIYAGAAQLEQGTVPNAWTEHASTFYPNLEEQALRKIKPVDAYVNEGSTLVTEEIVSGSPVSYYANTGRSLHYIEDFHAFWYDAPPSRASMAVISGTLPETDFRDQLGWYATPDGERFSTQWRINGTKIEQYNSQITGEVVGSFDIGELHLDEDQTMVVGIMSSTEDATFSRTLECLCVYKDALWVLCKETQSGITRRVIKMLNPKTLWPLPISFDQGLSLMHLECKGDVDVGMSTGTATWMAPNVADPHQFVVAIDGQYYSLDLEFDYFMIALQQRQAILRHDYEGELVTV